MSLNSDLICPKCAESLKYVPFCLDFLESLSFLDIYDIIYVFHETGDERYLVPVCHLLEIYGIIITTDIDHGFILVQLNRRNVGREDTVGPVCWCSE